jgi:putative ABC transport system permease protein
VDLVDSVRVATRALTSNKMRSGLTMLGVIIGVAAVIALLSIGQGVQKAVTDQIQSAGSNLLFILPVQVGEGGGGEFTQSLTSDDVESIGDPRNVPDVAAVAPMMTGGLQVTRRSEEMRTTVAGVSPEYEVVRNFEVAFGTFLTSQDVDRRARVAVLGADAAEELFPEYGYPKQLRSTVFPSEWSVCSRAREQGSWGTKMATSTFPSPRHR